MRAIMRYSAAMPDRGWYLTPAGKPVLEVQRNYEQALERAGASKQDACVESCDGRSFRLLNQQPANPQLGKASLEGWSLITLLQQCHCESETELPLSVTVRIC